MRLSHSNFNSNMYKKERGGSRIQTTTIIRVDLYMGLKWRPNDVSRLLTSERGVVDNVLQQGWNVRSTHKINCTDCGRTRAKSDMSIVIFIVSEIFYAMSF